MQARQVSILDGSTFVVSDSTGDIAARPDEPASAQSAPPPPPPAEAQWHVAENGQTKGPFGSGDLSRMAREGTLTRDSLVWTAGQDGWTKAGEVSALASVFAQVPPPPPPAG